MPIAIITTTTIIIIIIITPLAMALLSPRAQQCLT